MDELQRMADEVAGLMASRLGGARRGRRPDLATMIRRRGQALPRRHRKAADLLARSVSHASAPRIARQIDMGLVRDSHRQLVEYLRPLGSRRRLVEGATNIAASVVFGLLILSAGVIWLLVQRGHL
ncbi:hypothetical protein [uncultured Paracoccus sp.]|uniref:hypothetical protein n=1 Tax=uncultured Paracoccus sp. TaxID=189685 RepID=UPI00261F7547|nr:hypothetical protein [uncultured Paracoccus sp.]